MRSENSERKKVIKAIRDELCQDYTAFKRRADDGFQLIEEFKEDLDKLKGYAGIEFLISTERADDLQEALVELYGEDRGLIPEDISPIFAKSDYQISNGDGTFRDDPDHVVMRVILKSKNDDYAAMENPLSEAEEDAMRGHKSTEELRARDDDEVENRLNSYRPGGAVIKR